MGKKKDKKVKGAEKTLKKTEKNLDKKAKKELREKGEEDIETIVAQIEEQERKRQQIVEEKCSPPSPRCNMTLVPHPEKDILIMFGGEYFNGSKTLVYNDLFYYNIRTNEWTQVKAPNSPGPRCSHQAVVVHQSGGQMWVFGGEFASPSESQFYHYRDLWVFNLKDQTWQKINASGGPSSRSGHRMVACRKMIFVFGGFHDNIRDFKYFNDLHAFNIETLRWMKIDVSGIPPSPRSGCVMAVTQDNSHIIIYGGYSKEHVKKEVDKGQTHTDMFMLSADSKNKEEALPTKWKWVAVRQTGSRPSPRCSTPLIATGNNRALLFGGVFDEEEDDESVKGVFYNDMYGLELDKGRWHQILLRKKKSETEQRKRRRKGKSEQHENEALDSEDEGGSTDVSDIDEDVKKMRVSEGADAAAMDVAESGATEDDKSKPAAGSTTTYDDGIFTVRIGEAPSSRGNGATAMEAESAGSEADVFMPCPRMNPLLVVKHGQLYLYGGVYEDDRDRQVTLSDFYSLDLNKLNEWKTIIEQDMMNVNWEESDSSGSDDEDESSSEEGASAKCKTAQRSKKEEEDEDEEDDDDDDDYDDTDESEEDESLAPPINPLEGSGIYFDRTKDYWMKAAENVARKEGIDASAKQTKKAATNMAKEFWKNQKSSQKPE